MEGKPVESSQFACTRLGRDTQINVYSILRPIQPGTVLPATLIRQMHCQDENNCGIATTLEGTRRYFWHLCPASDIFTEEGTLIPSKK